MQVCPVCAENLGRDMVGHFTMQHAHMLKVCFMVNDFFYFFVELLLKFLYLNSSSTV